MIRIVNRGQKGFTLIELLMVVTIIGILVAIVAPAVAGMGSAGTEAQVEGDGRQAQTAVDSYQNKSTKGEWPEREFGTTYQNAVGGPSRFLDKEGNRISDFESTHTELDTDASTTVWNEDGKVITMSFSPSFLLKTPSSFILENDEGLEDSSGAVLREFIWVLKRNVSDTDTDARSVRVYRLVDTSAGATTGSLVAVYQQVF